MIDVPSSTIDAAFRLRLEQLVQSVAHSAECVAAAFYFSSANGGADLALGVGAGFASSIRPNHHVALSKAIAASNRQLVIVDDTLAGDFPVPLTILPDWLGQPTRFFAAVRVSDAEHRPIGLLVLADHKPRPGLSTAKTYVLQAQAAQLAETLAFQALRRRGEFVKPVVVERLRLLESVVVNAKDAILITEAEPTSLPGPRIVYCNAAFTRTTGYAEEEIIGKTPRILQGEHTDPQSRALIRSSLAQWKPVEIEMLNYKKDGEPFWVELSIVPVADDSGWYTHWVSVQRDVTERKSAEEIRTRVRVAEAGNASLQTLANELRCALEAAEAANVAKSQFLANMSHEIRTPLNGVLGMTQALWMDELTPAQRERVAIIRDSGKALLAVLNDVLDLSKIEAGHLELELIEFDLAEVARGVCAAYTEAANRNGVSFGLTLADEVRGRWRGDSVRIRQILYNLVSNALKFTAQGEVQVHLDRTPQGALRMRVRDTGIGMAADKLPALFSKFYQTDSSNTRRFGGTGLGLAICRQLCDLMGGSITAESVEGEGSTFCVVLPIEQVDAGSQLLEPTPSSAESAGQAAFAKVRSDLRVLAAEDNASNQLVLRALLQAFDITPTVVGNGKLAVEACQRESFDLVLMDVQMPEMDGVAATALIRAWETQRGLARTPIIALSANAMSHQVREYLATGMDGHISKPINVDQLAETLLRFGTDIEEVGENVNEETEAAANMRKLA
jgi:PAS domain S-box-containing protein